MSLKELRRRISSVKSTQKITAAMKMVASARLRRLQERVHYGKDYIERLDLIASQLGKINQDLESLSPWLSAEGSRDLMIIFGAEKGLCGSFHSSLVKKAHEALAEHPNTQVLVVGSKAIDTLKEFPNVSFKSNINFKKPDMHTFLALAKVIEPLKQSKEIGRIHIIGSAFKNVLSQRVYSKCLCPFTFTSIKNNFDTGIFEPSPDVFLPHFFTQYLGATLHQAWLETLTGEMASRMTAMDNATRNAKDMIDGLSLVYNRTRQAKITTELTEIIAGSEGAKQ